MDNCFELVEQVGGHRYPFGSISLIMNSKIGYIPELVGSNYLSWKTKMINVLKSKNIWRLANNEHKTPTVAYDLAIWEAKINQARGLIGQTVADSLQVSIEEEDSLVQVW